MFFDIPNKDGVWVYNTGSATWFTWVKPPQYNNFIFYVGGGGGGGAYGFASSAGNNRSGGGGGGGGCLSVLNAPSFLLPETLYIQVGKGGLGVSTAVVGNTGGTTYLGYYPNTNAANIIIQSAGGAGGNFTGTSPAGGAGGAAYSSQSIFSYTSTAGSAGTAAGSVSTGSNGVDFTVTTSCLYGGTGGASIITNNVAYAGGNIIASNIHPQINGGESGGGNGNSGYLIKKPFTAIGGTGGGSSNTSKGGNGGDGCWGSGGGGGAGGNTTNAKGGNGGDGFVIIIGY